MWRRKVWRIFGSGINLRIVTANVQAISLPRWRAAAGLMVLDPSLVVLGGSFMAQGGPLVAEVRAVVERISRAPVQLAVSALGKVDAVYDRAALVALPAPMRQRYARHLGALGADAPQLLISFDYAQSQLPGGLKGQCPADEVVWLLQPRT